MYCEVTLKFTYETIIENEATELETTSTTALEFKLKSLSTGELNLNLPNGIQGTATISIDFETFSVPVEEEQTQTV